MNIVRALLLTGVALMVALPAGAQSFGNAMAIGADEVFVGEPEHEMRPGLAYVFRKGADGTWAEVQALEASDGTPGDRFGMQVAADGGVLLVSATRSHGGRGGVYVFRKTGGMWTEAGTLALETGSPADSLGSGLAVSGEWIMVSSITRNQGRGTVFVFRRDGNRWIQHSQLTPADLEAEDRFGYHIALEGDRALVAAPLSGSMQGAVYSYRYDAAGDAWSETGRLDTPELAEGTRFGMGLGMADGVAVVGAPGFAGAQGAAFAYEVGDEGELPARSATLLPLEAEDRGQFGVSVAVSANSAWIGAPGAAGFRGRVFSYERDAETGEWTSAQKLGVEGLDRGAFFAAGVVTAGGIAVGSAPGDDYGAGTAFVFERDRGHWGDGVKIVSTPVGMDAITGNQVDCSDEGEAAAFGCQEVDLLSFLPVQEMGANRGVETNDVWGWTDPVTGQEIAIVGMTDQTTFVDVSNPYAPVYLGRLPMTPGANGAVWRDMKVYSDHVFVVSDGAGAHGMQVFDLTRLRGLDGSAPVTFEMDALYDRINSAHNIVINEETGFAYAVGSSAGGDTCGGGLHMIDIRDPGNPTFAGCFADATTGRQRTGYSHDAQCIVYRGPDADYQGHEICFGANETALSIADVTDKENPVAVSTASYPNVAYTHQGWISEDHAWFYMDDELDEMGGNVEFTRTLVWDISDLDDPILAKEHLSDNRAIDHNLYVVGNVMYQSNYVSGLRVLDISDPGNPVNVGYFDTVPYGEDEPVFNGSWSNFPFFESGIVVVTSGKEGLFLVRYRGSNLVP
ncbi:MAG: choice-of-anchor B family protein [Gemmatimonadota bacterium]|nr:choice-of-anchor B family protein [Gemmatimonadota bacterium]MDH5760858.1 choice-of-anchor B family protein [Gemmatimonadota bacterium]